MNYKRFKKLMTTAGAYVAYMGTWAGTEKLVWNIRELDGMKPDTLEKWCWKGVEAGWLMKDWDVYLAA